MGQATTPVERGSALDRMFSDPGLLRPFDTDPKIVMAEQSSRDVVDQAPSVGDASLSDDHATQSNIVQSTEGGKEGAAHTIDTSPATQESLSQAQEHPAQASQPQVNGLVSGGATGDLAAHSQTSSPSSQCTTNIDKSTGDGTETIAGGVRDGDKLAPVGLEGSSEQATLAEVSGGSDTDNSKTDGTRGHLRTNSVKKPASFKAVSVTKSFLAKAVAGSVPSLKLVGDKGSSAPETQPNSNNTDSSTTVVASSLGQAGAANQPPPRPRLVAKSGSGLRDAGPRLSATPTRAGKTPAPDASQVWNKNRREIVQEVIRPGMVMLTDGYIATQPAPPKQFTDEELKQQYGIHLATRLQADADGKESKWADIDDDDDDWAPETIEWNDGTKITLPHHEDPPAVVEVEPEVQQATEVAAQGEFRPLVPQSSSAGEHSSGAPKLALTSNQGKTGGLVLKGAPEKPVLVAKPPVPTPVKSPWAPLPPMEKMSPISAQAQPHQPPRFMQKDPQGFEAMPPPPSPAQEIAADDFNRSWRDGSSGASRELYNSQSGRYEPVNDARRGSMRNDQHFRQPSVLQRPSHHDQKGPAEPSAAFQTHRSSGQDESWGRRRTSSNVSGGSGNIARRMSFNKNQEMHGPPHGYPMGQRRGSQAVVSEHSEPDRDMSPSQANRRHLVQGPGSPMQMQHSPVMNQVHPHSPQDHSIPPQPMGQQQGSAASKMPAPIAEDPLEMQKKIMRESRELAMKRRKEQEEKEEAEKKERIRLKMEALGMPPPGEKEDRTREVKPMEVLSAKNAESRADGPQTQRSSSLQSPSKAASVEPAGDMKKYGSLKVQPKMIQRHAPAGHGDQQNVDRTGAGHQLPVTSGGPHPETQDGSSRMPNGVRHDRMDVRPELDQHQEGGQQPASQKPQEQPWKNVPSGPDTYTSWGGAGMTTHSAPGGNLWGPPSNDKALGNGTFDRSYGRLPARQPLPSQAQQLPPSGPGPIGPPNAGQRQMAASVSPHLSGARPAVVADGQPSMHLSPMPASLQLEQGGPGPLSTLPNDNIAMGRPGPIGRPANPAGISEQQRLQAVSAWKVLPAQLERQEAEEQDRAARLYALRLEEEARTGVKLQPTFKETWRQVSVDGGASGTRQVVGVTRTMNGVAVDEAHVGQGGSGAQRPGDHNAPTVVPGVSATPVGGRNSRFFPQPSTPGHAVSQTVDHAVPSVQHSSSPPPDSPAHPAYDGDVTRPHVLLPTPKPVVKLPPMMAQVMVAAQSIAPATKEMVAAAVKGESGHQRASSKEKGSWQDRIAGLFNSRKPLSPPKSHNITVNSATKAPLEGHFAPSSATVSLPRSEDGSVTLDGDDAGEITSKATEEALLEEREFGSLPIVRLPNRAPTNAWQPARTPATMRAKVKFQKPVQVLSIEPFFFRSRETPQGTSIEVRLPGTSKGKTLVKPHPAGSPRMGHSSPHWKNKGARPPKSREASGNYGPPRSTGSQQNGPSRQNLHGGNWAARLSGTAH